MEQNLINFTEEQKDKPIFRFLSTNRLFELFEKHANTLVHPRLWEDPFENHIISAITRLRIENEKDISIGFRDNLYGQCWTQTRESDAMWRIYSPNKSGVRITTTPRKLLGTLYENCGPQTNDYSCFLGKVKYYKTQNLKDFLDKNINKWVHFDIDGKGFGESLLFKRLAFKHENEVRLLYNSKFNGEKNANIYSYYFDPRNIIDDIVFDPRMEISEFNKHKKNLIQFGFKNRIVKSKLYDVPDFKIETGF